MPTFIIEPDPGEPPRPFVGKGGFEIDNDTENFRSLRKKKGADLVSATPERGGICKPDMRFRAFNASSNGMTVTNVRNKVNRAPDQVGQTPLSEFEGLVIAPGLPPVPKVVNPNPNPVPEVTQAMPTVPQTAGEPGSIIIPIGIPRPTVGELSIMQQFDHNGRQPPAPTKSVTFIGEFSDHVFPCFDVRTDENGWLILISPILNQLKLKANQDVEITVDGQTATYWFTGLVIPMPESGATIRVFGVASRE